MSRNSGRGTSVSSMRPKTLFKRILNPFLAIFASLAVCLSMMIPGLAVAAEPTTGTEPAVEAKQDSASSSIEEPTVSAENEKASNVDEQQPRTSTPAPDTEALHKDVKKPVSSDPAPTPKKLKAPVASKTAQPEAKPTKLSNVKNANPPKVNADSTSNAISQDTTTENNLTKQAGLAAAPAPAAADQCGPTSPAAILNSFTQRSDETDFHKGLEQIGLYEGGVVHQKVAMTLPVGQNTLVFDYQAKYKGIWAYDRLVDWRAEGASIDSWSVVEGTDDYNKVDVVTVVLNVAGTPGTAKPVTLFFDAHIASSLEHGFGFGAASITGSAYHVRLRTLNCAQTGSRDNQIKADKIQFGTVHIAKVASPSDGTDFDFKVSENKFNTFDEFQLDDSSTSDTGEELPASISYTMAPSTVTITENDLPSGWTLSGITCVGATATRNSDSVSFTLLNGTTVTCTFTNSKITYKDLTLTKTATPSYDRDYDWSIKKTLADGQAAKIKSADTNVTVDYDVLVEASKAQDSNFKLKGIIKLSNPNSAAMSGVTLKDQIGGTNCVISNGSGVINGPITVAAGTSEYSYSCDMPDATTAASSGTNTASATWDKDAYYGTDGSATASADYNFASVTPKTTDDKVTITDDKFDLSTLDGGNVVKASDAPKTFHYSIDWTGIAGECTTENKNTAKLSSDDGQDKLSSQNVEICVGKNLTIKKLVVSSFNRSYDWDILKEALDDQPITADPETGEFTANYKVTVTPLPYTDSSWAMSGTITVDNDNKWQAVPITVEDQVDLGPNVLCTVTGVQGQPGITDDDPATAGFQTTIGKDSTLVFTYSCDFNNQKPESYDGSNKATVTWSAQDAYTSNSSETETVSFTAGDWTQTPLNDKVTITDDNYKFGDAGWTVSVGDSPESMTRNYSVTWKVDKAGTCQDFSNTAVLTGNSGLTGSSTAEVKGCRDAGLTVSKTAKASYDRTYHWSIDKKLADGQPAEVVVNEDGKATINYEVEAKNTGYTDSNRIMTGVITVKNPNTFKDVEATVTDSNSFGAACSFEFNGTSGNGSLTVTVPKNETVAVNYSCDVSEVPESDYSSGKNTATVTWGDGLSANSSAVDVIFTEGDVTDKTVQVYDDQAGLTDAPKLLGEVSVGNSPQSFKYPITFEGPVGNCADFTNKAWVDITGDEDPSDQQTVTICDQENLIVSKKVKASYERDYDWSITKEVDKTDFTVAGSNNAEAHYKVTAKASAPQDSAKTVSGTITITNPNKTVGELTATVTDIISIDKGTCTIKGTDADADADGFQVILEDEQTVTLDYDCVVPEDTNISEGYSNTALVIWGKNRSQKAVEEFTFEPAKVTDEVVTVVDNKTTGDFVELGTLNVSEAPKNFDYTLPLAGVTGTCTDYTNTAMVNEKTDQGEENSASAKATVCSGADLFVEKNVAGTMNRSYLWDIDKELLSQQPIAADPETGKVNVDYRVTVTQPSYTDSNWKMTGQITVVNTNDWQDVAATLTDVTDIGGGAACTITGVDGKNITDSDPSLDGFQLVIPRSTTWKLNYECSFTSQPSYEGKNTATVTWDAVAASTSGSSHSFSAPITEGIWDDTPLDDTVTITDTAFNFGSDWVVKVGESPETMTRDYTVTWTVDKAGTCQDFPNTAKLLGDDGFTAQDSVPIQACRDADLTVTKTAKASYDRTHHWSIDKKLADGQAAKVAVDENGNATINYVVEAKTTGYTDSDLNMSGVITVANPNKFKAVDAVVTDQNTFGAQCSFGFNGAGGNGSLAVTVPADDSVKVSYSCDVSQVSEADYKDGTNTAVVTWGDGLSAKSNEVDVNFTERNATDETVQIFDDHADPSKEPTWLGSLSYEDKTGSFPYSITFQAPAGQCADFTNKAWVDITGDEDPSDQQTVTVCDQENLIVSKDVIASYERDYDWSIDKQVDQTRIEMAGDGKTAARYTVTATPSAPQDSAKKVSGTIHIENPNTMVGELTATVKDVISIPGASCAINGTDADPDAAGFQVILDDGEKAALDYDCLIPQGTNIDGSYTNTPIVTWGKGRSAGDPVQFVFDEVKTTDKTVEVVDDKTIAGERIVLGTADVNAESNIFTYELDLVGTAGTCTDYTNTAAVEEDTDQGDENSASAKTTVCAGANLSILKNVVSSFDRSYLWNVTKETLSATPVAADPETGKAVVDYRVTVAPQGHEDGNWAMSGQITVANENDWQDVEATITDVANLGEGVTCTITGKTGKNIVDADLEADGFQVVVPRSTAAMVLDYSCTFTSQPEYSGSNTAAITWDAVAASTTAGEDTATAEVTVDTWSQTPKNDSVTVSDTNFDFNGEPWVVKLGDSPESMTRDYSVTWMVDTAGTCQEFTNTAVISGKDGFTDQDSQSIQVCREAALEISKTADASYDRTYQWSIIKSLAEGQESQVITDGEKNQPVDYLITAENTGYTDSGWELDGVITVANPNDYTGIDAALQDTVSIKGVECTLEQTQVSIPAKGSVQVGYSCDVASGVDTADYLKQHNTVTATWGEKRTASATADVDFSLDQAVNRKVDVFDDQADPTKDPVLLGTVDINESPKSFANQLVLHAPAGECASYTNTAWVDVSGDDDPKDSSTVQLCGKLNLDLGKDASASFDRTYLWDLDKQVDRTKATVAQDGSADFNYTVSALPNGYKDSGFEAHGMITVANPNHFPEADAVATLTDTVDIKGVTCSIDAKDADADASGLQIAVPAGAQLQLPYSCTGTPQKLTGTNTVAISWGGGSTATAQAAVEYTLDRETNSQITVVDDKTDPENPVELGTASWNAQGTPVDFNYTLTHQAIAGQCTEITNTAVIKQTGASDSTTVDLCGQKSLVLSKSAVALYDKDYEWIVDKQLDETKLSTNADGSVTAHYTVEARTTGVAVQNLRLNGTVEVANPNEFGSITATLVDKVSTAGAQCTIKTEDADKELAGLQVVLKAGETLRAEYDCTLAENLGIEAFDDAVNTISTEFDGRTATASAAIDFTVDKVTDQSVSVIDDKTNPQADPVVLGTVDAKGAPKKFSYDLQLAPKSGTCTVYTNTAKVLEKTDGNQRDESSVDVQLCSEAGLVIAKTAAGSFHRDFDWKVSKDAKKTKFTVGEEGKAVASYTVNAEVTGHQDSDWAVTGSITVMNPNDFKDTELTLEDKLSLDSGRCVIKDSADGRVMVLAGKTLTVYYDCSFDAPLSQADYEGMVNEATATWRDAQGVMHSATATADVSFTPGSFSDDSVQVFDDFTDAAHPVQLGTVNAEDEKVSFVYDLELGTAHGTCSSFTNTAWVVQSTGDDDDRDSADVQLCAEAPLALDAQAEAAFDRQYLWELAKAAAEQRYTAKAGEDITVGYTVNATPAGVADTGHRVSGSISLSNPNAGAEPLAVTLQEPGESAGMKCSITAKDLDPKAKGIQLLVPAAKDSQPGVLQVPLDCEGTPTQLHGAIKVQASYQDADMVERQLKAEAKFEYQLEGETDKVISVTDDLANPNGEARVLGEATWNEQGTPKVFTYDVVFKAPNDSCLAMVNTAQIVQTGQKDSATVDLCAQPPAAVPPAPRPAPVPPAPQPPAPLASTGAAESLMWMLGASGTLLIAGALMLLRYRRRQNP